MYNNIQLVGRNCQFLQNMSQTQKQCKMDICFNLMFVSYHNYVNIVDIFRKEEKTIFISKALIAMRYGLFITILFNLKFILFQKDNKQVSKQANICVKSLKLHFGTQQPCEYMFTGREFRMVIIQSKNRYQIWVLQISVLQRFFYISKLMPFCLTRY